MKRIYIVATFAIFWMIPKIGMAQQDPMFTQYMFNMLAVNPAYAGSADVLNLTALHRSQWVGIDGAPITQTVFAHTPISAKNMGLGLSMVHDQIGPIKQTMAYADYSYTLRLNKKAKLAFGLKGGLNFIQANLAEINIKNPNDELFLNGTGSKVLPNFGFGVYYHTERFYAGISSPKLVQFNSDLFAFDQRRHYFVTAGAVFDVNDEIKFKPTALVKVTEGAPLSVDLSANFLFNERFWVGLGHRFGDSFTAMIQYQFTQQFKVGYAYDLTISKLARYNSGSHEIMVSYDFNFDKTKRLSPRYF